MGQTHSNSSNSSNIRFEENTLLSKTDDKGCIVCSKSCSFTNTSVDSFTMDRDLTIHCKITDTQHSPIAFGILPKNTPTKICNTTMVGQAVMKGSIGCYIDRNTISLYKDGSRFFNGPIDSSPPVVITIKIKDKKITFLGDDKIVNSEELSEMTFDDGTSYKLGLSMSQEGQQAEVFMGCPVTFRDCWSAGTIKGEALIATQTTNFTFFTKETLKSDKGRYVVMAKVLRNASNDENELGSISFGILPVDCKEECQKKMVGMCTGSYACHVKANKTVTIVQDGDTKYQTTIEGIDSHCMLKLVVEDGNVSFFVNEQLIGNDTTNDFQQYQVETDFKVGVGLDTQGQIVEMRGDLTTNGELIKSEGDIEGLGGFLLRHLMMSVLNGARGDNLRWDDCMNSISCDGDDRIAVGVKKHTATLLTHRVVDSTEKHSVDIRILKNEPSGEGDVQYVPLMMLGVLSENTPPPHHAYNHLGASDLRNSLGLTNRGDLISDGAILGSGLGFEEGDIVTLSFDNGNLSIKVNGTEAVPRISGLSFESKFRWAVTFTDENQAVKIGSDPLTPEENRFCIQKGIITRVDTTDDPTVASEASDATLIPDGEDDGVPAEIIEPLSPVREESADASALSFEEASGSNKRDRDGSPGSNHRSPSRLRL